MVRKIILKLFLLALPLLFVVGAYWYSDPFKVLRHYDVYPPEYITTNRDYASTETFLHNFPVYNYDSYLFGPSTSWFYRVDDWEKHIHAHGCFHFDAMNESLYGVEKKISFLYKNHAHINNVLFIFDTRLLSKTENEPGHLFMKHPLLSGQNKLLFQMQAFKDFLYPEFLVAYYDFLINHKRRQYMQKFFIYDKENYKYDTITNEISLYRFDSVLRQNPDGYYEYYKPNFYKRDTFQHYGYCVIGQKQKQLLQSIKKYMTLDNTNYRIVISPLYNQYKIDPNDLQVLYQIFGKENVFDFSGINPYTANIRNYYDNEHYRPFITAQIMDSIYAHSVH